MATASERLATAILKLPFAQIPQEWEGNPLDIPGITSTTRDDPWDALVTATAPGLPGDQVRFARDDSGRTISGGEVSSEALLPLVEAVAEELGGSFWAIAVPEEDDDWTAAATESEILELADAAGDQIEVSRVGGELSVRVDGEDSATRFAAIDALLARKGGDTAIVAHRFAGPVWVAEVFAL